jgi:hypothetical protein
MLYKFCEDDSVLWRGENFLSTVHNECLYVKNFLNMQNIHKLADDLKKITKNLCMNFRDHMLKNLNVV